MDSSPSGERPGLNHRPPPPIVTPSPDATPPQPGPTARPPGQTTDIPSRHAAVRGPKSPTHEPMSPGSLTPRCRRSDTSAPDPRIRSTPDGIRSVGWSVHHASSHAFASSPLLNGPPSGCHLRAAPKEKFVSLHARYLVSCVDGRTKPSSTRQEVPSPTDHRIQTIGSNPHLHVRNLRNWTRRLAGS
jgi:hypothetical protein